MNQTQDNRIPANTIRFKIFPANSALTCHVIGALLATILVASIYWVAQNRHAFSGDQVHTQSQVDEASNLISHAGQIRQQLVEMDQLSAEHRSKIENIQNWLPQSIDFDHQRSSLIKLADGCGLHWSGLHRENQHDGVRLSVVSATCHVTGTLDQICLFLHKLPAADAPIWCNGISLEQSVSNDVAADTCTATINLRLPFAGQNTIAEKLIRVYQSNAT